MNFFDFGVHIQKATEGKLATEGSTEERSDECAPAGCTEEPLAFARDKLRDECADASL